MLIWLRKPGRSRPGLQLVSGNLFSIGILPTGFPRAFNGRKAETCQRFIALSPLLTLIFRLPSVHSQNNGNRPLVESKFPSIYQS